MVRVRVRQRWGRLRSGRGCVIPARGGDYRTATVDPWPDDGDGAGDRDTEGELRVTSETERPTLVLTGASRGIGHATVKRFSAAGWRVITCSRQPFSDKCPWPAGPLDHIEVDLADPARIDQAVEEIRERLQPAGRLDALVNNAGISPKGPGGSRLDSRSTPMELWKTVFQVNLFAPIMLARGLFPELEKAKGSVVNVTSIAGGRVHPFAGTAYSTSKAALAALTREMAADFGPHGIRVNAIAPGEIDTAILSPGTEKMIVDIPLRRLGKPAEVADTIFYLCTDASSYVTGAEIHINGGQHV
jgi:NAD(P)-dependent dehydrogenase (short-subunit alcohol dehydrogenase family)